jgi:hypothetical protein
MSRLKTLQKWLVFLIFSPLVIISFVLYFGILIPLLVVCMPKAVLPRIKEAPEPFMEFWGNIYKSVCWYYERRKLDE